MKQIKGSGNPILDELEITRQLRAHKDRVSKARFKFSSSNIVNEFNSTQIESSFKEKLFLEHKQKYESPADYHVRPKQPTKYEVMANIEIERSNKLLYDNLTKIENKTKITWNPMVEKSE